MSQTHRKMNVHRKKGKKKKREKCRDDVTALVGGFHRTHKCLIIWYSCLGVLGWVEGREFSPSHVMRNPNQESGRDHTNQRAIINQINHTISKLIGYQGTSRFIRSLTKCINPRFAFKFYIC